MKVLSDRLRVRLEPAIRRALHTFWRFSRGMTLGVRAAVIDANGGILLVRHSYVSGWHLPGGGVEVGETMLQSLARELAEEANVVWTAPPVLHGIFLNAHVSRRDHVAVYVVRAFRQGGPSKPNREILEWRFFQPHDLPAETSPGTRARIAEIFDARPSSTLWQSSE
jgi:ADP-ribose pyrophosphatase YjhB (NUDIX family)